MTTTLKEQDPATRSIYSELKKSFPKLSEDIESVVYRYNPVCIRVRVIDSRFRGLSYTERQSLVMEALASLPEQSQIEISMLLALTAKEAKEDLMNLEFDEAQGQYL